MRQLRLLTLPLCLIAAASSGAELFHAKTSAASKSARAGENEFRDLYRELVEINTTQSAGSCTKAAQAMQARLLKAGYAQENLHLIVPPDRPKDGNLVAELKGTNAKPKPILLLAHIDVVEAKREDWQRDPFTLTEEDGYFYGRGAADDKAMAAVFTDAMARFKREGYRPKRGIKMALTCGEETPNVFNGVEYLIQHHRPLIDAEFAINEGGGGRFDQQTTKYLYNGVQVGEKLYQDFTLETTNKGGHSSRPTPDNAIYELAQALIKIQAFEFPVEFNQTTRAYLQTFGDIVVGTQGADMKAAAQSQDPAAIARLEQDPTMNGMLHTTCVATMIDGGHAPNALPQHVSANVNCRIFPGHAPEEVRQTLIKVIGDENVKVSFQAPPETPGAPPQLTKQVMAPIEALTRDMFPGVPVLPTQASGATDGRFLTPIGIPTYGVSGMFSDGATTNAHGLNERIRVQSLMEGREFLYRLTKMYADGREKP